MRFKISVKLKRRIGKGLAFVLSAAMVIPGSAVFAYAEEREAESVEEAELVDESGLTEEANSEVSGNVKLSSIPDGADVVMTADTVLEIDTDKTIASINDSTGYGSSYTIEIKGEGKLTVNRDIQAKAITIDSGSITVKGGDHNIYASGGNVTIKGGEVNGSGANIGILSETGSVNISGGTITVVSNSNWAIAANDITIGGEKTVVTATAKPSTSEHDINAGICAFNSALVIQSPLAIVTPEGGSTGSFQHDWGGGNLSTYYVVLDSNGRKSLNVVIKNPASVEDDTNDDQKNDQNDDKKEEDKKEDESNSTVDPQKVNSRVSDLYKSAFGREATEGEIKTWADQVVSGEISYANLLVGIIQSPEFKNKQTTDKEYVISLYTTIFGRTPTDEEVKSWTDKISGGMSRDEVMRGFVNSEEAGNKADAMGIPQGKMMPDGTIHYNKGINDFVSRCYTVVLGRKGEKTGVDYWTEKIYNKEYTPEQVITGFVDSKEFANRELSDDEFLEVLYKTFFDRASDEAGQADWNKQLKDGKKRIDIIPGFARSVEFKNLLAKYGM